MKAELFIQSKCINAEGPVWDDEAGILYFIDVEAGHIFCYKDGALKSMDIGEKIGTMALCQYSDNYIIATASGIHYYNPKTGEKTLICDPERALASNRFNDGKADPFGRFVAGTLSMDQGENPGDRAALYSLKEGASSSDCSIEILIPGVNLSNGLAWSEDGSTFYFVDTGKQTVSAFEYDQATGSISNGQVIITVPDEMGHPDGMTIDMDGNLWIALWGGSAVSKWNPKTGQLIDKIEVDALNVSSCCFGGEKMDTLFITTASQDTDMSQYPLAGNVFVAKPGVKGARTYKYVSGENY